VSPRNKFNIWTALCTDSRLRLPALVLLALFGCDGSSGRSPSPDVVGGGGLERSDLTYAIVTHGTPRDPFWSVVSHGAQDAARDLGVRVSYQVPNSFDMVAMSRRIDAVVVSRRDGLVVSVPGRRRS